MEENRKQQLAISSSKPSASGEVAPSFAGNDNCDGGETKAITPDQFMEGTQNGESTHENPTILRLEEPTSMDPTAEVVALCRLECDSHEALLEEADSESDDSEALVNYGAYASVKSQVASGKGTKTQTSSTAQAASQTQSTNKNGAS